MFWIWFLAETAYFPLGDFPDEAVRLVLMLYKNNRVFIAGKNNLFLLPASNCNEDLTFLPMKHSLSFVVRKPFKNMPRLKRDAEKRKLHFLSVWFEDMNIKQRLKYVAAGHDRTMNNFVNHKIAPMIQKKIDTEWAEYERRGREKLARQGKDVKPKELSAASVLPPVG